jgi:hypothetical protein
LIGVLDREREKMLMWLFDNFPDEIDIYHKVGEDQETLLHYAIHARELSVVKRLVDMVGHPLNVLTKVPLSSFLFILSLCSTISFFPFPYRV